MLPLLTFATGIVAGIVGVQLLKQAKAPTAVKSLAHKARSGLEKAGDELRDATVSGLSAVEKSSASLRARLAGEADQAPTQAEAAPASVPASPSSDQPAGATGKRKNEQA